MLTFLANRSASRRRLGLAPRLTVRDVVDSLLWMADRWLVRRRAGRTWA